VLVGCLYVLWFEGDCKGVWGCVCGIVRWIGWWKDCGWVELEVWGGVVGVWWVS